MCILYSYLFDIRYVYTVYSYLFDIRYVYAVQLLIPYSIFIVYILAGKNGQWSDGVN